MHLFVQACILGLLTGGVYALMASGLALGFGVMRVINVAQGALIILGAYLSYSLYGHFGIDPFVGLLIVTPAMFLLGDRACSSRFCDRCVTRSGRSFRSSSRGRSHSASKAC